MNGKPAPAKFLLFFRDPKDQPEPTAAQLERLMAWMTALRDRGDLLTGHPLAERPACVLRGRHGAQITDGPFPEAKEVVGGFLLITARDFAAAARLAQTCPILAAGTSIEVREVSPMDGRAHMI